MLEKRRVADEADTTKRRNVAERALAYAIHELVTILAKEKSMSSATGT